MNEMIMRVARALHGCGWNDPAWAALDEDIKALHFAHARATIEAMHEPTEAMVRTAEPKIGYNGALYGWRAMIDAALKDD